MIVLLNMINKSDFEFGYSVSYISHDQWGIIYFEHAFNPNDHNKYSIQFDDLLFGLVDMINFIEKYKTK